MYAWLGNSNSKASLSWRSFSSYEYWPEGEFTVLSNYMLDIWQNSLNEKSSRCKAPAYTGQNTKKHGHTPISWVGFEPTIPLFERSRHSLYREANMVNWTVNSPRSDCWRNGYWSSILNDSVTLAWPRSVLLTMTVQKTPALDTGNKKHITNITI
jgi:hypothetical protein